MCPAGWRILCIHPAFYKTWKTLDELGKTKQVSDNSNLVREWEDRSRAHAHTTNTTEITSEGAYNFYGFFVDTFGNKLATSPFTSTTQITSFTLGTYT